MLKNTLKWLAVNLARLAGIPDIEESHTCLDDRLKNLDRLAAESTDTTSGATELKREAREGLIATLMKLINHLRLFATKTENIQLLMEVSLVKSDLDKSSSQLLQQRAELIIDKANAASTHEQAEKYNVTPETINPAAEALAHFKETTTHPRQKMVSRSTANELFDDELDDAMDFLRGVLDIQLSTIETDDPEIYRSYKNVRKIID